MILLNNVIEYLTWRRRAKRDNSPAFFIDLLALG